MKLYSYYRSSAAYRVRIALNLKQIEHSIEPINLIKNEHKSADYITKQPQGLVPCLETNNGQFLAQSGAILSYLDTLYPNVKLLPADPFQAAKMQSFVDIIACDIHPICNLRVLNYLTEQLNIEGEQKLTWYRHWVTVGLSALETMLDESSYSFGEDVTLADLYLIPQLYNALRFEVEMSAFPKLYNVYQCCNQLEAFINAKPENQTDAV
ncbi:maleylacetoacetate isomerase [uncultured Paraglaciecola sp.]|uniref:maleylacetoacetate isomerase n=1 Tax=uncultured Paraglaciecola sp. TaxID=1765024 RepID=UPI0030DA8476|tara:strand:- start:6351 stop:6980 length:630 start_codon:yes stop_codon:yes gene_type:complete